MTRTVVWDLNLDAELELLDPAARRSSRMAASIRRHAALLLPQIRQASGDAVRLADDLADRTEPPAAAEAWCPTPAARARLAAAGAPPPDAPPVDVLSRVNHRAVGAGLAATLPGELPGAAFVTSVAACEAALARAPARAWLLKRPLGFSGRMRKVVVPSAIDPTVRTWIAASMAGYGIGLAVEPLVERVADFALHGRIARGGEVLLRGRPVLVGNDARGSFVRAGIAPAGALRDDERGALEQAFDAVAAALAAAGYFGPFGIDAFRWRDEAGVERFRPLVEINARYTMAWWTGTSRGAHATITTRTRPSGTAATPRA